MTVIFWHEHRGRFEVDELDKHHYDEHKLDPIQPFNAVELGRHVLRRHDHDIRHSITPFGQLRVLRSAEQPQLAAMDVWRSSGRAYAW